MPETPVYGDLKVATRPIDAPLVNPGIASADAFGVGEKLSRGYIADGIRGVAISLEKAQQIREREQEKRDETEAMDATNQAATAANKSMAGYMTITGGNVRGLSDTASKEYDKNQQEIAAKIKSPGAKKLFVEMSERRKVSHMSTVEGHMAGQIKEYETGVFKSGAALIIEDARASGDPERIKQASVAQAATILRMGDHTGEDPKTIEAIIRDNDTALFGGHAQDLMDQGKFREAATYLEENKERIGTDARSKLGKKAKDAAEYDELNTKAQDSAAKIFNPEKSLESMYAEADKIPDQKEQAIVKSRLNTNLQLHEQAKEQKASKLTDDGIRHINAGEELPPLLMADLNQIDPKRAASLLEVQRRNKIREDVTTDQGMGVYQSLKTALSGANGEDAKQKALKDDPMKYAHLLSKSDLKELINTRVEAGKAGGLPKGMVTAQETGDRAMSTLKIPTKPDHKGVYNADYIAFSREYDRGIRALGGTDKVTPEQCQTLVDKLTKEYVSKEGTWRSFEVKTRMFNAPFAKDLAATSSQLSSTQIKELQSVIKMKGGLVDDGSAPLTEKEKKEAEAALVDTYNASIAKPPSK